MSAEFIRSPTTLLQNVPLKTHHKGGFVQGNRRFPVIRYQFAH